MPRKRYNSSLLGIFYNCFYLGSVGFEFFWGDIMSQVYQVTSEKNIFALNRLKTKLSDTIKYEFDSLVIFFQVWQPEDYII